MKKINTDMCVGSIVMGVVALILILWYAPGNKLDNISWTLSGGLFAAGVLCVLSLWIPNPRIEIQKDLIKVELPGEYLVTEAAGSDDIIPDNMTYCDIQGAIPTKKIVEIEDVHLKIDPKNKQLYFLCLRLPERTLFMTSTLTKLNTENGTFEDEVNIYRIIHTA